MQTSIGINGWYNDALLVKPHKGKDLVNRIKEKEEEKETEVIDNPDEGEETEELTSEEEEEVEIITHYKKEYYIISNESPQYIYAIEDGELGEKVGEINKGKKCFYKSSKK